MPRADRKCQEQQTAKHYCSVQKQKQACLEQGGVLWATVVFTPMRVQQAGVAWRHKDGLLQGCSGQCVQPAHCSPPIPCKRCITSPCFQPMLGAGSMHPLWLGTGLWPMYTASEWHPPNPCKTYHIALITTHARYETYHMACSQPMLGTKHTTLPCSQPMLGTKHAWCCFNALRVTRQRALHKTCNSCRAASGLLSPQHPDGLSPQ